MKRLAIAPHRLYFFLGALAALILFVWWWRQVVSQTMAVPLHALVMPLGIFPLFILGFTFTAGPRWLSVESADHYFLLHGGTYFCGLLLVLVAAGLGWYPLRTAGFVLMLAAWLAVTWRWGDLIRRSKALDKKHPVSILIAMLGGMSALLAAVFWSAGNTDAWQVAREFSFFGFLLPVFLTVSHRMLPFFSSNVLKPYVAWRPYWLLGVWLGGCWLLVLAGITGWRYLEAFSAGVLSLSFVVTSWRWGIFRSLQNRMLAMLHLSFAWLAVVFGLQAAGALGVAVGSASIHALGLGFMGTMLVAFVSRVSYGHSGRPLQVSNSLWMVYLGLHLAAMLRIVASLLVIPSLLTVSATVWLLLITIWIAMMLPVYLKARADGQPG
ncbi:NnrS family protein [Undibacterium aquatile]|uniref:NnrS family protein n=1 Tax=Undibacterium aquatile TaxID=1537398 RepID=A0ABR6XJI6_9BURK|nr:NnrS family protein [Undibacterium aquatile]MBC3812910.1 NnrS family protein [Undibacterium aquatile]